MTVVAALAEDLDATRLEVVDGVVWLELARPERFNARNQRMREELTRIYDAVGNDPDVRVLVLTGSGDRAFCSGMDLKEATQEESPLQRRDRLRAARDIEQLAALPLPTIAAINGVALGGGLEMALACDLRVAAHEATMGFPEVGHGLVPGGGGTQRLPALLGTARAYELLYLGDRIDGRRAAELGLVNASVPATELRTHVTALAARLSAQPSTALRLVKESVRRSQEVPLSVGIEAELELLLQAVADRRAAAAAEPRETKQTVG